VCVKGDRKVKNLCSRAPVESGPSPLKSTGQIKGGNPEENAWKLFMPAIWAEAVKIERNCIKGSSEQTKNPHQVEGEEKEVAGVLEMSVRPLLTHGRKTRGPYFRKKTKLG